MEKKAFIDSLFEEKAKKDENSQTLARMLDIVINTGFGEANHFILELLQNADDSAEQLQEQEKANEVIVELRLIDDYLIFSHSGKHFTEKDIRGICNVGSGDSGKDKDSEKTGYKGIGFKSIFAISDQVSIVSNEYIFKFDKDYDLWKDTKGYPWQIIPIWVTKEELEKSHQINFENVNIVISISNKEEIKSGIIEIFKDPQIMIFLRHISKVIFYEGNQRSFSIEKRDNEGLKTIYVDDIKKDTWLYEEFFVDVTEDVREKIKNLDSTICPDKLKSASRTKITFATIIENGKICEVKDAKLYCYLPTRANYGFNYLINADFITNAARTELIEGDWNAFIFNKIAICSLQWIAKLVKDKQYIYSFVKLLKNRYEYPSSSKIKTQFNKGLEEALASVSFVPRQSQNEHLLKINECIVDNSKFLKEIDQDILKNIYGEHLYLAEDKIENITKLNKLGGKKIDLNDAIVLLSNPIFRNRYMTDIDFNIKIMKFIYDNSSKSVIHSSIKSTKFLLSNEYEWETPETIYFQINNENKNIFNIIDIKHICTDVFDRIKNIQEIITWLNALGVKETSEIDIFRKSIIPLIKSDRVNIENAVDIGKFVFKLHKTKQLTGKDYEVLMELKLVTTSGNVEKPSLCYLSDYYNPKLKLQKLLHEGNYVSSNYVIDQDEITGYKLLFLKMGVSEGISIHIEESIERNSLISKYSDTRGYFNFIDNDGSYYEDITRPYIGSNQHGIRGFLIVDHLRYTEIYDFSKVFWKELLNKYWEKICYNNENSKYYTRIGSKNVISYLKYYVTNKKCIPSNRGICYEANKLYSNSLEKIIGEEFPLVDSSIKLNKEQEEFLGVKTTIDLKGCYVLLDRISKSEVSKDTVKRVEEIYKQIVNNRDDKNIYGEEVKLLATNDTYQSLSKVYCFNVDGVLPPTASEHFIKISHSFKDKEILCSILRITLLAKEDLNLETDGLNQDNSLRQIIIRKLKYFLTLIVNLTLESPQEVFNKLTKQIASTKFFISKRMYISLKNLMGESIYNQPVDSWYDEKEKSIYYVESIKRPLTLYSLASSLECFFGIEGNNSEIALLLQLSEVESEEWLKSQGYSIVEINMDDNLNQQLELDSDECHISDLYDIESEECEVTFDIEEETERDEDNLQNDLNEEGHVRDINLRGQHSSSRCKENKITENVIKEVFIDEKHSNNHREKQNEHDEDRTKVISNTKQNMEQKPKGNRLLSYVYSEENGERIRDIKSSNDSSQFRTDVIDIIRNYEISQGRNIEIAPDTQNGYDFLSYSKDTDNSQRYIIFFGFWSEWNSYDMPLLSKTQIDIAREQGEKYWIYIVENLVNKDNAKIYRIKNPYNLINLYAFDLGWKALAEQENPIDKFVEGAVINHSRFGDGTIDAIKSRGKLKVLTILFEMGKKNLALNLNEMSIKEEK